MDTSNMSKAEADAETKKWTDKYFDFAESAVKEWIAETFDEDVETLFDDYTSEADVLNVKSGDDLYTLYLTSTPPVSPAFAISKEELLSDLVLQRATSMMYEAVFTVFMPVVGTMSSMQHLVTDIFPTFDEATMSFRLVSMNAPYMKRKQLEKTFDEIKLQEKRLKSIVAVEMSADTIKELKRKLSVALEANVQQGNEITNEMCKEAQLICDERNKAFETRVKLYVCLEKNKSDIVLDQKLKRMPQFGLKYQDPDEETLIDQFKQEYNIQE